MKLPVFTDLVRVVRVLATTKAAVGLLCVGAMIASGRVWDLSSKLIPLVLPCALAAIYGLRSWWLAARSTKGLRYSWSLFLILGACAWCRAPLLTVANDIENTGVVGTWLYAVLIAAEGFPIERLLPLSLLLVAVPKWTLKLWGQEFPMTWALPLICAVVPIAVEFGKLPDEAYWLACVVPVPFLMSKVSRRVELGRAVCVLACGFMLAIAAAYGIGPEIGYYGVVFSAAALIAFTPFPRRPESATP